MARVITRPWLALCFQGLLLLAFGLVTLLWPHITLAVLGLAFVVYAIASGLSALAVLILVLACDRSNPLSRPGLGVYGLIATLLGLAALFWPHETGRIVLALIAAQLIILGLLFGLIAASVYGWGKRGWAMFAAGIVLALFGASLFIWPRAGAEALARIVAVVAIVAGSALFASGLKSQSPDRTVLFN